MADRFDVASGEQRVPPGVDVTRPNVARMYDYWLGGSVNYRVDRDAADRVLELEPMAPESAWANRGFLQRAAGWMTEQGVDQMLDLGAGLPSMNNTHEVVHRINPRGRVVYVDSDPDVCAHGLQLVGNVDGAYYIQGDIRDLDSLLKDPVAANALDFTRPIGLLLVGLLYFVADPLPAVRRLVGALAPGSFVAVSHVTGDGQSEELVSQGLQVYRSATEQMYPRSRAEVQELLVGLDLIPPYPSALPGLCYVGQWGCEQPDAADDDPARWLYAGVGRKP